MPIRSELKSYYPENWNDISARVRFRRARGCCEQCGRPHGVTLQCLPDGRWYDEASALWRDDRGSLIPEPDLEALSRQRSTRVVLAAAHLNHNPADNRMGNLRALCQRCHLLHDRAYHRLQRWVTCRKRWASADLFLGPYTAALRQPIGSKAP